ncbi:FMN-dependent oxidoreductase, nitrilotriacetate monooxygenase family [Frankia canadensis]|uniref:FMN-dependent oxidoreductase, nitrilotriacetate monooxygenase family n=1 Tax=Frankia canadensis TaxID=1836972 RepID=A0A2I2KWQ4_9ACTN|nr:NtaA/DmoA family FMN-dependent monooxygenase [Frankia canadensis]SNQ50085.1 FMN-dependent oxidoreductase, nitrilotriacetate monooxygenase family [Frankia canadensis]SOU57375.1 FMN-dependent oxidoreductase, nitrilotriacetate monooxygenase family [Frankia canadensis]
MAERLLHLNVNGNGLAKPPNSWRRSDPPTWFLDVARWEQLGRIAERGLLDAVFLADHLGATDFSKPWHAFDPFMLQTAVARATSHIGLVATLSATFYQPWDVARRAATLDLASGGRAAVNIVTSGEDAAAALYGRGTLPERDVRYARAEEVLIAVKRLWDSWDQGALVADPAAGELVKDSLVPTVDYDGTHVGFTARFQFPRSVQGRPVIVQAGASPRGIDLAAQHADAVFCAVNTIPTAQEFYRTLKARAAAHGRDPDELLILPGLNITLGGTEAEARARRADLDGPAVVNAASLGALSAQLGVPVDLLAVDRTLPWDFIDSHEWRPRSVGAATSVLSVARRENLTVRQLLERRAHAQNALVGTPEQVADEMEAWFTQQAADGFNINFDIFPSGLEQVSDHLVPELQRRGIFRREYTSTTLRGHYGLPPLSREARPGPGAGATVASPATAAAAATAPAHVWPGDLRA